MNTRFEQMMSRVLHLTQTQRLTEATAAIQAALNGRDVGGDTAVAEPDADSDVIDIEAREVVPGTPRPSAPPPPSPHAAPAPQSAPQPEPGRQPGPASAPAATSAPAVEPAPGGTTTGSHTDAAGTRRYKLFVPPGTTGQGQPLVVMLHGCKQDPDAFAAGTGMNEAAAELGWCVLYPEQANSHNPQRCWSWFKHNHQARGRGEPALLAGMVQALVRRHGMDPRRVYVAGLSAGGAMAAILGDSYPEVFAAVGVHSGLATGAARDVPSAFAAMQGHGTEAVRRVRRPPTIVFHGDRDGTVHPVNGERVMAEAPDAPATTVEQRQGERGRPYTQHIHRQADGRVVAEHWVVHGGGHAWSGGSRRGSYTDPRGPDATREMLRFFGEHAQPAS